MDRTPWIKASGLDSTEEEEACCVDSSRARPTELWSERIRFAPRIRRKSTERDCAGHVTTETETGEAEQPPPARSLFVNLTLRARIRDHRGGRNVRATVSDALELSETAEEKEALRAPRAYILGRAAQRGGDQGGAVRPSGLHEPTAS